MQDDRQRSPSTGQINRAEMFLDRSEWGGDANLRFLVPSVFAVLRSLELTGFARATRHNNVKRYNKWWMGGKNRNFRSQMQLPL